MCPGELAMFTNKTTRMFGVFAIVVAMMLELVTVASMPASDSALAVKALLVTFIFGPAMMYSPKQSVVRNIAIHSART